MHIHFIKKLGILGFFVIIFLSCGKKDDSFRVGLLMDSYVQERWTKDRDMLVSEVEKLGGTIFVESANGDDLKQIDLANKLIAKDIDVLIIVPVNLETSSVIIENAHKKDIKVIAYDRLIKNCDLDFYISFDNVKVGILQAQFLVSKCSQGNFALINGPIKDNNSYLLKIGQLSVLQPYMEKNQIRILCDDFVDKWSQEQGFYYMKKCFDIHKDTVDAVLAGNDDLARGAINFQISNDTIKNKKIYYSGQDADLNSCQLIARDILTMTVYKPIKKIASTTANIAYQMAMGQKIDIDSMTTINNNHKMVPTVLITPMMVCKENIKTTVVKDGYLKEEDIYK